MDNSKYEIRVERILPCGEPIGVDVTLRRNGNAVRDVTLQCTKESIKSVGDVIKKAEDWGKETLKQMRKDMEEAIKSDELFDEQCKNTKQYIDALQLQKAIGTYPL